jgi:hypothetical protein
MLLREIQPDHGGWLGPETFGKIGVKTLNEDSYGGRPCEGQVGAEIWSFGRFLENAFPAFVAIGNFQGL